MENLSEILGSDHEHTFRFFFAALREETPATAPVNELKYNASILAHYAQTSTESATNPVPRDLCDIFDKRVMVLQDIPAEEQAIAGAECLLLVGFFRDYINIRRHNIRWYAELGGRFFASAARNAQKEPEYKLMLGMYRRFNFWVTIYQRTHRTFRDSPYLIRVPPPSP